MNKKARQLIKEFKIANFARLAYEKEAIDWGSQQLIKIAKYLQKVAFEIPDLDGSSKKVLEKS